MEQNRGSVLRSGESKVAICSSRSLGRSSMSTSTPREPISLGAVFVACWLIGTVVLTVFVDWSISVELRPGYRMVKDEALWPMRVLFGCLFAAIQGGVVVALLAFWRRVTRSHEDTTA
jgi:uncharacterized protein (DUF2062 family)